MEVILYLAGFIIAIVMMAATFQLFAIRKSLDKLVMQGERQEKQETTEAKQVETSPTNEPRAKDPDRGLIYAMVWCGLVLLVVFLVIIP